MTLSRINARNILTPFPAALEPDNGTGLKEWY